MPSVGYCTPGLIVMVAALLAEEPDPAPAVIRDYLAGSLCRCCAYPNILRAGEIAGERLRPVPSKPLQ